MNIGHDENLINMDEKLVRRGFLRNFSGGFSLREHPRIERKTSTITSEECPEKLLDPEVLEKWEKKFPTFFRKCPNFGCLFHGIMYPCVLRIVFVQSFFETEKLLFASVFCCST
jgi:hypothetical protein